MAMTITKETEMIQMVKTLEQFETLTSEQLATIKGGGKGICKPVYTGANGYSCRYSNGE